MDSPEEVESYSSAAAEQHLEAIDDTFVEHLLRLLPQQNPSAADPIRALDVGCGPAQIPVKILGRVAKIRFVALDRFPNMLACARRNAARAGVLERLTLVRADAQLLPFPDHAFSVVICNSVLHHAREPVELLREIFRVASPAAAILVRDLRRPSRMFLSWHLWRHGRRYSGPMRRLFNASVRASYTAGELAEMLSKVAANQARVFRLGGAHLSIERAASGPAHVRLGLDQTPLG
ncbi:MAG: class I SAM-dependent methyltransferase [Acidobacteria bacterium]|nr:class I SAM-dependent methyltransferase [Acidobacteriota bacterium]